MRAFCYARKFRSVCYRSRLLINTSNARGSGYVLERRFINFIEITQSERPLRHSRSFKVADFGTNRKLIYNVLLVINTNLPRILHHFQVMPDYGQNSLVRGKCSRRG